MAADVLKSGFNKLLCLFSAINKGKACPSYEMWPYMLEQRAKSPAGCIFGIENACALAFLICARQMVIPKASANFSTLMNSKTKVLPLLVSLKTLSPFTFSSSTNPNAIS